MSTERDVRKYERRRERRIEQGLLTKFPTLANRQLAEKGKKYCPGCKQIKDIKTEFSTMKIRSGISSHCRECIRINSKAYSDSEKGKSANHKRYLRNREKDLNNKLIRNFGITLTDYNNLLEQQSKHCAICPKTIKENGKMLAVDHNHKTGMVRGLLCSSCNILLGFIEKNNLPIDSVVNYLTKYSS